MGDPDLRRGAVRAGLIAGGIVVYLGAVGMIGRFEVRNLVGSEVRLGRMLMVVPLIVAGYVLARPRIRAGELWTPNAGDVLPAAAVGGVIGAGVISAFLALVAALGVEAVRPLFISVSPALLNVLQWGRGLGPAVVVWIVVGVAAGAAGAGLRVAPRAHRRALVAGLSTVLVLSLLQRLIPSAMREVGLASGWLYSPTTLGLTWSGALVAFAAAVGTSHARSRWRDVVRTRLEAIPDAGRTAFNVGRYGLLVLFLFILPNLIGSALTDTLGRVGIFLLLALGLNIVVGYAGLLDLGYVAFFAAGAYITALLTGARVVSALGESTQIAVFDLNFWIALPLIVGFCMIVGLMIGAPVLRLRGDYLAIVTLGFGEIMHRLLISNALRDVVGGAQGMRDIPEVTLFPRNPRSMYYLALVFIFVAIYVSYRLERSRIGRAWNAMREDEQVAEVMGVSTIKYKLLAFVMGAALGSLGGAVFAVKIGSLSPQSFVLLVSIVTLAVVILGGMGSIRGVIVGSLALIGIPELLSEFEEFRLLIYGAVLVGIMILRPEGLIPNVRRSRELHEEEMTQDRWLRRGAGDAGDSDVAVAGGEPS